MKLGSIFKNEISIAAIVYFFITWIICFRFLIGDYLPLPLDNYLLVDKQKLNDDKWTAENWLVGDSSYQMYPWRKMIFDGYKKGAVSSFNSNIILGNSLLGNGQSAPFYPGNIFFIFGFNTGWKILFFSQFFLAAFFTFLFLKSIRFSFYSSILGGVVFGYSGFIAAWDSWTTVGHTVLWLPLMFLSINQWKSSGKLRWIIVLTLSIFCSITAGFPQFALYCIGAAFCYLLFLSLNKPITKNFWLLGVLSFAWGLGLSALQILPIISLLSISNRISQFKIVNLVGVPFEHFMTFLVPGFFGWPNDRFYFGSQNFNETANYFGIVAFVLVIGVLLTKFRELIFWKLLFLLSLLLIINNPISELLSNIHALIFGRGLSGRLFFVTIFAGSVLSAKGLEKFIDKTQKNEFSKTIFVLTSLMLLVKIAAALRYFIFPNSPVVYKLEFIADQITFPLILLGLLLLLWLAKKYLHKSLISIAIILLVCVDLVGLIQKVTPWSSASLLTNQSITNFKSQLSDPLGKTIGFVSTGENNLFNIPTFEGYDSIYPKSYLNFLKENCGANTEELTNWVYVDEVNCLPSLQKYGLKYIVDKDDILINQLKKRWGSEAIDKDYELVKTQNNFAIYHFKNYKYPAEFKSSPGLITSFSGNGGVYKLKVSSAANQQLTIYLNNLEGWNAKINAQSVKTWSDGYGFINLYIPAGESEILLEYLPQSIVKGVFITLITTLTGLIFLVIKRRFI